MLEELEQRKANKPKWEEKKSRSEKISKKQLIEESVNDGEVISNIGGGGRKFDVLLKRLSIILSKSFVVTSS